MDQSAPSTSSSQPAAALAPEPAIKIGWFGMREKLILLFVIIKVLPLIGLMMVANYQVHNLGNAFKEKSSEMAQTTQAVVNRTGELATKNSIKALDIKSREAIERLTIDLASEVASFLYSRDDTIRQAAGLPVDEKSYRAFVSVYQREVIYPPEWVLNKEQTAWEPKDPPAMPDVQQVEYGSPDNEKDFHYTPPQRRGLRRMQPLYHEMTFVGLDGHEKIKISMTDVLPRDLRDVSRRENTWCKAEDYFAAAGKLKEGEIYVSPVIGPYVPSPVVGAYTPAKAKELGIPFAPEEAAYAGKENPVGKHFQGLVRWVTPVFKDGKKIGYVTMALDHTHLMEFTDHVLPTSERFSDIADAGSGNYAFIWDYLGRNICHPRNHSIVGYDPQTGQEHLPWISSELLPFWEQSNGSFTEFEKKAPQFLEQTNKKKPVKDLTRQGNVGLDCRYLNFAPQCAGWMSLTQHGGSGSFVILWTGLWKLTTAAAIPYHTGMYGQSERGFGFVTIGADVNEFHRAATETAAKINEITAEYVTTLDNDQKTTLAAINKSMEKTGWILTISTLVMIVIVIVVAIWLASAMTRRITRIMRGVNRFKSGDFSARLKINSPDEMGQLGMALNDVADQLQKSISGYQEAKERAEESDKAKSLFLANISHEIRTPMNAIIGMASLARQAENEEERRQMMKTVGASAENLLRLLDDILDFSKMEAGQLQLNAAPFNLPDLLASVISIMNVPAVEKKLRLRLNELAAGLPAWYLGDELRLRQIFLNLTSNAVKFTDEGSIAISVVSEQTGDSGSIPLHFIIADTGIGIPKEKLETIFNRFEQVDPSYSRRYSGTGLGLSISKQLVALMGGRIWAESVVGAGTSFHVILPLSPTEAIECARSVDLAPARAIENLRILVVDDNQMNRDVARMMLERHHRVVTANNGLEALTALTGDDYDLILMDVQMPRMDGIAATMAIRDLEQGLRPRETTMPAGLAAALGDRLRGGHIPIVAMTAHAMSEDRENCLQAGMDAYISKPFKYDFLLATMAELAPHIDERRHAIGKETRTTPVEDFAEALNVFFQQSPTETAEDEAVETETASPELSTSAAAPFAGQATGKSGEQLRLEIAQAMKEATQLSDETVQQLVASARKSLNDYLDKADKSLENGNREDLSLALHTLKGMILQCGLRDLGEEATAMYERVQKGENRDCAQTLARIRWELAGFLHDE
jgi:signal transduction histidine kinase/DNA-binding response OmpR family regulator